MKKKLSIMFLITIILGCFTVILGILSIIINSKISIIGCIIFSILAFSFLAFCIIKNKKK